MPGSEELLCRARAATVVLDADPNEQSVARNMFSTTDSWVLVQRLPWCDVHCSCNNSAVARLK